jgi:hypothetical protein
MPTFRDIDPRQDAGAIWVGYIDNRGTAGRPHVADVERLTLDPNLAATGTIDMRHEPRVVCVRYH